MKAQLHKLPLAEDSSFLYKQWECAYFDKPWHFHEEYELVLIDKSKGTTFIGDNVSLFQKGDLFLIGSNIPHIFRNNEEYYTPGTNLQANSIFIHFTERTFGTSFLNLPELKPVRRLLEQSAFALQIYGDTRKRVAAQLQQMQGENSARRLLILLDILLRLSESRDTRPLLSAGFTPQKTNPRDSHRIQKILEYIMRNYHQEIYMATVASMLNMSEAAFSRYFKHHTHKTFSHYLTDVRISNACRMIMQGEENIAQVAYLCGFENLSNFYRHFKKVTGLIPKEYRNRFLKVAG